MGFSDAPISFSSQDKLGNSNFANSLAKFIYEFNDLENGFVLGISGSWGSGKTSVLNLIATRLRHLHIAQLSQKQRYLDDEQVPFTQPELDDLGLRFLNIHDFDNKELNYNFLSQDHFNRTIARKNSVTDSDAIKLYRYFRLKLISDERPKCLVVNFSPWQIPDGNTFSAVFISELAGAVGSLLGEDIQKSFDRFSEKVTELSKLTGAIADVAIPGSGGIIAGLASLFAKRTTRDTTLEGAKSHLEETLRTLTNCKIVVVIDDLDRLSPKEAAQMVSLVKGLGRLPNVFYVLAYDSVNLIANLDNGLGIKNGAEYLEKIVQFERALPMLREGALASILDDFVSPALKNADKQLIDRFSEAWRSAGRHLIANCRDVTKLGNVFLFSHSRIGDITDPSDLFLIEAIKLKDRTFSQWIGSHLDALCGEATKDQGKKQRLKQSLEDRGWNKDSPIGRALSQLFPRVAEAFETYGAASYPAALKDRRLYVVECAPSYFDAVQEGEVLSRTFVSEVLSATDKLEALDRVLSFAASKGDEEKGIISFFLELFSSEFGDGKPISQEWLIAIVKKFPDFSKFDDEGRAAPFSTNNFQRLCRTVFRGLDSVKEANRPELVLSAIAKADDVSLLADVVRTAVGDLNSEGSQRTGLGFDGRENEIRETLLAKVREIARGGLLWSQNNPSRIIWFWWGATNNTEVKDFLDLEAKKDQSIPGIVEVLVGRVFSTSGDYDRISRYNSKIIDLEKFRSRIDELASSEDDEISGAVEKYLAARKDEKD